MEGGAGETAGAAGKWAKAVVATERVISDAGEKVESREATRALVMEAVVSVAVAWEVVG